MDPFATSHFSDDGLLRDLDAVETRTCTSTAVLLSRLAEVDARKLYVRLGFESMRDYCVDGRRYSEGTAYKRIHAARAARRFALLFVALADGRLRLSGVVTLAPHLTSGNLDELVAAAAHKTTREVEQLIAHRFPRPDLAERVRAIPSPPQPVPSPEPSTACQLPTWRVDASGLPAGESATGPVEPLSPGNFDPCPPASGQPALGQGQLATWRVGTLAPPARVTPLAPQRFALQLTISQGTYEKLQHARALLGHTIPTGEIAAVLDRALDVLIAQLEKRKFAATPHPRPGRTPSSSRPRHIPAEVKRAVCERDGRQCTFVGDRGRRCSARGRVEFDHIQPVAHGGESTVENLRLRCRAHNQYEAECVFGADFMSDKIERAQRMAKTARNSRAASTGARGNAGKTCPAGADDRAEKVLSPVT